VGTHRENCGCASCHEWRKRLSSASAMQLLRWGGIMREMQNPAGDDRSIAAISRDIAAELSVRGFYSPLPHEEKAAWEDLYRRAQHGSHS